MGNSARSKTVFPFYLLKTACIHRMQFKGLGVPNKYFAEQNSRLRSNESPSGAFKRQNGLRQQMEGPRPDKFADVYTSALLAGAMKPLNVLSKFENRFVIRTVRFQVQLEADGCFSAQKIFVFASAASRASWYQLAIF